jgi:hypothetical protein
MPRDRKTRKPTPKEVSAIRSRIKDLVGREIGQATIIKDKLKEREFKFDYQIDDFRSLSFKIIVTPVVDKAMGAIAQMSVNPGKPP